MSHVVRQRPARGRAGLFRSDDGAAAVEYALLSALIAGAIVMTLVAFGSSLSGTFSYVASAMDASQSGASNGGGAGVNGNGNGKGGNGKGNNGNGKGNGGSNQGG